MSKNFTFIFLILLFSGCAKDDLRWSKNKIAKLAKLSVNNLNQTNYNSFLVEGTISWNGDAEIVRRGFCYSLEPMPDLSDSVIFSTVSTDIFIENVEGLFANNTYYVRAFAENSAGVSYSEPIEIRTPIYNSGVPIIITIDIDSIAQHTAIVSAEVANESGFPVSSRGVCYASSNNPTVNNNVIYSGSGLGSYDINLSGLQSGTTYYLRSFATNQTGTAYGNQLSFTTLQPIAQLASVVTSAVSNYTATTALAGGNVINNGNTVFSRGLCYDTLPMPDLSNSFINIGFGSGNFNDTITNLKPSTTYYIRAFATNTVGTSYGNQVSFTSGLGAPNLIFPVNNNNLPCCYFNLKWSCLVNAASYDIQISSSANFNLATAPFPWASGTNVLTTNTLVEANIPQNCNQNEVISPLINRGSGSGIFYWRVRARNGNNVGDWSAVQSFVRT
jgi:hypothetical protein